MPLNEAWNRGFRSFLEWRRLFTSPLGEAGGVKGATKPPSFISSIKIERAHKRLLDFIVRTDAKHIDAKAQLEFKF